MSAAVPVTKHLFARHKHLVAPVDGRLVHFLSPDGRMAVEVTFDASEADKGNRLYVNLVGRTGDTLLQMTVRLLTGRLSLNASKDGAWGEEVVAKMDFSPLRCWRIWLVLEPSGVLSARLGDIVLCALPTDLTPQSVAAIESNVSAQVALPVTADAGDVFALAEFTDDHRAVLLLFVDEQASLGPKALRTSRGPLDDIQRLTIAGRRCWRCTAEFEDRRSAFLSSRDSSWPVQEVLAAAAVELDLPRVTFRSSFPVPEGSVQWRSARSGGSVSARPAAPQAEGAGQSTEGALRHAAMLSDMIDAVSADGAATTLLLEAPGLHGAIFRLSLDPDDLAHVRTGALSHPCVVQSLRQRIDLQSAVFPPQAPRGVPFAPGISFDWGPQDGDVDVRLSAAEGKLLVADIRCGSGTGALSLNLDLGPGIFAPGDVLGFAAALAARAPDDAVFDLGVSPFVRSGGDGGSDDTPLADTFRLEDRSDPVLVLHRVGPADPLTWRSEAHTLVLPLPRQAFTLELTDFRVFFVPA